MLKQKLLGLALVALGILSVFIEYDATFAVLFVPIGLYLMLTKRDVL